MNIEGKKNENTVTSLIKQWKSVAKRLQKRSVDRKKPATSVR